MGESSDDEDYDCLALSALSAEAEEERGGPDLDEHGQLCLPSGSRVVPRANCDHWRGPRRRTHVIARRADPEDLRIALERRAACLAIRREQWVGVARATEARQERVPQRDLSVAAVGVFDGGCKLNNERGHQCYGQGKRHQNAAVHAQPKKHGGKLAKWSSGPARRLRKCA